MRVLLYRHWYETESGLGRSAFRDIVVKAVPGVDGVREFFIRSDGFIEIRMEDLDAPNYWVPASQVLAFYQEIESGDSNEAT